MKASTNLLNTEKLVVVWEQKNQSQAKPRLLSGLSKVLSRLMEFLVAGDELRIWQSSDRFGNTVWNAYDPVTNRSTSLDSEAELRTWIEERHYQ